ncbi:TPA: hypothetical protein PJH80_004948 [Raoultella ornithinolytica]|nr:hypothetical protein [Raoultella ornithinolytica]
MEIGSGADWVSALCAFGTLLVALFAYEKAKNIFSDKWNEEDTIIILQVNTHLHEQGSLMTQLHQLYERLSDDYSSTNSPYLLLKHYEYFSIKVSEFHSSNIVLQHLIYRLDKRKINMTRSPLIKNISKELSEAYNKLILKCSDITSVLFHELHKDENEFTDEMMKRLRQKIYNRTEVNSYFFKSYILIQEFNTDSF